MWALTFLLGVWNFGNAQEKLSTWLCCAWSLSCVQLWDPMDYSPPVSSVHGDSPGKNTGVGCHFLPHRIFPPRDLTHISCTGRRILYHWTTWQAHQVPHALTIHNHLSPRTHQSLEVASVIIPIVQMRKPRLSEVKYLTQGHPVSKWQSEIHTRSGGWNYCSESRCGPLSPGEKNHPSQWGQSLGPHLGADALRCHLWLYQVRDCCAANLRPKKSPEKQKQLTSRTLDGESSKISQQKVWMLHFMVVCAKHV